jgi:hypothetical protein
MTPRTPSVYFRSGIPAWSFISILCAFASAVLGDTDPKYYAVEASATYQTEPPQITLSWPPDANASSYEVARKSPDASVWGAPVSLPGGATSYVDTDVSVGTAYEYQVSKSTTVGYAGYGYLCAGINVPVIETRGTIILVVENLYAGALAGELARLQQDLVGDGWKVVRHEVSRSDSPVTVKNLIQGDYAADPTNVRAVFLFGHVPVPYSGNFNPDDHPNHQGAWPADLYYGDMEGTWTDESVNNSSAERQANWNVPGDGKFDQSDLPADVTLEVGRVDLANMTCYANKSPSRSEEDLLRQYLNKDHNFRHGLLPVPRRGLICDNFGEKSGEAFAASGWRNFAAFFGADNVTAVAGWNYFPTVAAQGYLWSYGCGGGDYYTCDGIGSSDDFATNDVQTVFTMFLGSYFGDWDNESNFLRAPLGSTSYALAVAWAGRPHWFFHHMGLGETIGYSTRLSQNNRVGGLYSPQNDGTAGVHVALLGDPTLRLHPVLPPSGLNAVASSSGVILNWTASPDTGLQGYRVYRGTSLDGPFINISGSTLVSQTTFTDPTPNAGVSVYMVRTIKLEHSGSGTYFNPSQGIFYALGGNETSPDAGGSAPGAPSPSGSTGQAQAYFVGADVDTQGNWIGAYGADGRCLIGDPTSPIQLPSYVHVSSNGANQYLWSDSTLERRALEQANGAGRVAACWYQQTGFSIDLNVTDGKIHRLAIYCLDWDQMGRAQSADILDPLSGRTLDSQTLTNFAQGKYLIWDIGGHVTLRLTKLAGNNSVLMGLFFSSVPEPSSSSGAGLLSIAPPSGQAGARFQLHLTGQPGSQFLIQASTDLLRWQDITQVTLSASVLDWTEPGATGFSNRYYRALPVAANSVPAAAAP